MAYLEIPGAKKKIVVKMSDSDFEKFIIEQLPKVAECKDIKKYEFAAYQEADNDSDHCFNTTVLYEYYKSKENSFEYELNHWREGEYHHQAGNMLSYLTHKGIIEPAEYIVSISY